MQSSDPSGHNVTCIQVTEADIIGQWSVTGTVNCLQARPLGFIPQTFSPVIPTVGTNSVALLGGTINGTRTFYAGGSGRSVATSHTVTSPETNYGVPAGIGSTGGASVTTVDVSFVWSIQGHGTLVIDDDNSIAQQFTAPPSLLGQLVTIENFPSYVGFISKDKRTITLTHSGMSLETSVRRNASGAELFRTPRYCARSRVMTRLLP
jgi:hypothetical protein